MTTMTEEAQAIRTRVEWASVPRVNLLPPEIIEGRAFKRTQRGLAGLVLLALLGGAAGTFWAQRGVTAANAALEQEQAVTSQLQAQQRKYAEVPRVIAQVDAALEARESAMSRDVLWYRFLDELAADSPNRTLLGSLKVSMADASGGIAKDALTPAGQGEVLVSGQAKSYRDVATWLSAAVNVTGMELSRLQTAERKDNAVDFAADVRIDEAALSHRYDRKAS